MGEVHGLGMCSEILRDDVYVASTVPANTGYGDHTRLVLCIFFSVGSVDRTLKGRDAAVFSESRVLYNKK
jgi:hypothetical protein